ncbi:MAG: cell division protein FtsA [Gammaproteobacteria bacterium]|nr:MAG: cell division protein FtsA [Gammaproteobacteria bacterium]
MGKKSDNRLLVGLDIGTSKIAVLVGEYKVDGEIDIIGVGSYPSRGLKKGIVANIDSTVQSIRKAVEDVELMSGCEIIGVNAGIAGAHISGINSHGVVAARDKEIQVDDVERVMEAARAMNIPADQQILHVIPQDFIIDGQEGITEPVGMSGVRLEAKVHIVTCALSAKQNLEKCIKRAGLEAEHIVLEQFASAEAVLTDDEKELGVCVIDIGAGTTDIAVFVDGAIRHTAAIPIAGDQVTSDIAISLRTPMAAAEELKRKHACANVALVNENETIETPDVAGRKSNSLQRARLAEVVEPRMVELFELAAAELRHSGYMELLGSGIVLTGGTAKMPGTLELAEELFHLPVRLGLPMGVGGMSEVIRSPQYATGVGLVLSGLKPPGQSMYDAEIASRRGSFFSRMKNWFGNNL